MATATGGTATRVERDTLRRERIFGEIQRRGALVVLIVVVAVSALVFDLFLTAGNIENILLHASFVGLISVGMTFVVITGGVDLSVGSLVALGGVLAALTVGVAWPLGFIVPILVCGVIGLVNGLLIAKAKLPFFIVTLAGLLGFRGLALVLSGAVTIPISDSPAFVWFGQGEILGLDVPIVIMLVAFAIGALVLNRTRYGEALFAVGGSEEAARLSGVKVDWVKIIAYTVSGALAGFAGALVAAWLSAGQPLVGQAWELYAIASVVLGGTLLTGGAGTMLGSLAGVLLFYTIQNVINQVGTLTSYTQQMVTGAFLIVVVAAQTYLSRKRTY
jgi:ribose/xylose/arabinose/galactoside ABC-type transport system permease subunit